MRDWRKLHSKIVGSEKLAACSFEARWLWALLIVAQDDDGKYPWTPIKVRQLITGTDWDISRCEELCSELALQGLCTRTDEGFVELVNGAEMNGHPTSSRNSVLYELEPRAASAVQPHGHGSARGEERRVDQSRGEARTAPALQPKNAVDEDFIAKMVVEYGPAFGGEAGVRERIGAALNHTASRKWIDKQKGVRDWLRRDAESANGARRAPISTEPMGGKW